MKTLNEVKHILKKNKLVLKNKFGVQEIGIFGSCIHGGANKKSDIDILIGLNKEHKTFDNYMELEFFLEKLLNVRIDLVMKNVVRKELKKNILSEVVYV